MLDVFGAIFISAIVAFIYGYFTSDEWSLKITLEGKEIVNINKNEAKDKKSTKKSKK